MTLTECRDEMKHCGINAQEGISNAQIRRIMLANLVFIHLVCIYLAFRLEVILIIVVIIVISRVLLSSLGPVDDSTAGATAAINNVVEIDFIHVIVIISCYIRFVSIQVQFAIYCRTRSLPSSPT
ncbi:hypothetical protein RRF57_010942 [Xylaria bambusicola]|uniref:Uncharacterized protein n=1 Tax=Xylaria bambusicola TaxID=326684 RepID=A0AAN7ULZ5_9PEZI